MRDDRLDSKRLLWTKAPGSLSAALEHVDRHAVSLRAEAAMACRERITRYYSWDKVARDHERYFRWILGDVLDYADSF